MTFLVVLSLFLFSIVLATIALKVFRTDRCPYGTFYSTIVIDSVVMVAVPLTGALFGLAYLRAIIGRARAGLSSPVDSITRNAAIALIVSLPAVPALIWLEVGNELCLSYDSIALRANSLSSVRTYAWSDIVGVQAICAFHHSYRHSHETRAAHFILRNGDGFWLTDQEYRRLLSRLAVVLAGVAYRFDSSDIDFSCPRSDADLFSRRP